MARAIASRGNDERRPAHYAAVTTRQADRLNRAATHGGRDYLWAPGKGKGQWGVNG